MIDPQADCCPKFLEPDKKISDVKHDVDTTELNDENAHVGERRRSANGKISE
jgi:hypothetical protein